MIQLVMKGRLLVESGGTERLQSSYIFSFCLIFRFALGPSRTGAIRIGRALKRAKGYEKSRKYPPQEFPFFI